MTQMNVSKDQYRKCPNGTREKWYIGTAVKDIKEGIEGKGGNSTLWMTAMLAARWSNLYQRIILEGFSVRSLNIKQKGNGSFLAVLSWSESELDHLVVFGVGATVWDAMDGLNRSLALNDPREDKFAPDELPENMIKWFGDPEGFRVYLKSTWGFVV